jgi:hypothetical protein
MSYFFRILASRYVAHSTIVIESQKPQPISDKLANGGNGGWYEEIVLQSGGK